MLQIQLAPVPEVAVVHHDDRLPEVRQLEHEPSLDLLEAPAVDVVHVRLLVVAEVKELVVECDDAGKKLLEAVKSDILATVNASSLSFGKGEIEAAEGLKLSVKF